MKYNLREQFRFDSALIYNDTILAMWNYFMFYCNNCMIIRRNLH